MKDSYKHIGVYAGKVYAFTHRNPKTGEWYTPETQKGSWVKADRIKWIKRRKG